MKTWILIRKIPINSFANHYKGPGQNKISNYAIKAPGKK